MERKTIYLCLAHMSEAGLEQKYVKEAFDTNWVVPMGPNVNAFEDELTRFVASKASPKSSPEGKDFVCYEGPNMVAYVNGVSESIFKIGFCLPAGPYVSDEDVRYIVDCIKEAIV